MRLAQGAMPPADRLRLFVRMQMMSVEPHDEGVVLVVGPPGYLGRRRLLLVGLQDVIDLDDRPPSRRDWEQLQIDIGDDMYERQRHDEHDSDIEPDRTATKGLDPI